MNEGYTHVYLSSNSYELIRAVTAAVYECKNNGYVPHTIVTDAEGFIRIAHAAKRKDGSEWRRGLFMDLEVLVGEDIETKVSYLVWGTLPSTWRQRD
jgi:hypothetical protein